MNHSMGLRVVILVTAFCGISIAQENGLGSALESPVKMERTGYAVGEVIVCSLQMPSDASLFGTDVRDDRFLVNELFSPYRVFGFDENCNPTSTWSTQGAAGATSTGICFKNSGGPSRYWHCDPTNEVVTEHETGTGVPTGSSLVLPAGGMLWGSMVVDDNQAGDILCINDILAERTSCIDMNNGGLFVCSYANNDHTGSFAFGNGTTDAVSPEDCSWHTLINASGTKEEGQVTRAGQYDCFGIDPACTDRWDLTVTDSTFVNGICEFVSSSGTRDLFAVDNIASVVLRLAQPLGATDCQDTDSDMDLIWVNASQGDALHVVDVDVNSTLSVAIRRTSAGNGKFVYHMNAGSPSSATIGPLFDLGNECFPFRHGVPVVIANSAGKTQLVGPSHYFGERIADPAKAPTFLAALLQERIDTQNLPAGSAYTHQLIALNGATSSSKGGSLSNAIVMKMR